MRKRLKKASLPYHVTGKNMDELIENLKAEGFDLDSADVMQPQDKVTLYKDGKTYQATFNEYFDGGVEVISFKEVENKISK